MSDPEIELNPADFVTIGTVGPKGRRLFHLQAGTGDQLITLIIEKEQARALAKAINELLDELNKRYPDLPDAGGSPSRSNMSLRDPIEPLFRVAQMGLGFDETRNMVLLIAQELLAIDEEQDTGLIEPQPQIVRMYVTREQARALSNHALDVVKRGRADPKSNGHLIYYWM